MKIQIKQVLGHVELYINGVFYCTADNHKDAMEAYNEYVKERLKNENKSSKK